jgi:hypothetical protein
MKRTMPRLATRLPRPWLLSIALLAPLAAGSVRAQVPDLRSMSGRPLTVADLPPGTVSLRVVRQSPANPVAGVEVTSTTRTPAGEARSAAARTGPDGRATFENLPSGADFQATVTVDGERLDTIRFPLPRGGGTRIMLIAGLGQAGAGAAPPGHGAGAPGGAQQGAFRMGAPTGTVAPVPDLPAGTLELDLRDAGGQPLAGKRVQLAQVRLKPAQGGQEAGREVGVVEATSDQRGRARFTELLTGEAAGYAAVTEHEGLRLGTQPFRMPVESGMRGQILALRRTADRSALQLDPRSKIILQLREESIAVMMALFVRNTSQELFDPGEEGLILPLPDGAVGAQELEGSEPIEITPGVGIKIKNPIPPDSAAQFVTQVRFGYVLLADGSSVDLRQTLPISLPEPFILAPARDKLDVEGSGVRKLPDEKDSEGARVLAWTTPPVPASGTLSLAVTGIPSRDRAGRTAAATLCIIFIVGAVILAGPLRGKRDDSDEQRESLSQKREKLFAELVTLEQQRKADEPRGASNGKLGDRRRELVGKLETVYRELAKLEDQPGA